MALPRAVQEANDLADRLANERGMKGAPGEQSPGNEPKPAAVQSVAPAEKQQERIDPTDYKARFSNYKRETDTTISEQRQEIAQLRQQFEDLRQQNSELASRLATAAPAQTSAAQSGGGFSLDKIPQSLRDKYDDDYLGDLVMMSQAILANSGGQSSANTDIDARLRAIEADTASNKAITRKTVRQLFYEELDEKVPEWEVIGADQQYYSWMDVTKVNPPFDNRLAKDAYNEAMDNSNAPVIIALLKRFKSETGWASTGLPRQNLEGMVTPQGGSPSGSMADDLGQGAGVWTESAVNKFYVDVSKGVYTRNPQEAQRIESEIKLATQQGKILPG